MLRPIPEGEKLLPLSEFRPTMFADWLKRNADFRHPFAKSTLDRYLRICGYFLDFCQNEAILAADEVNSAWLRRWLIGPDSANPRYSASTRTVMLSATQLLYLCLQEGNFAIENPVEKFTAELRQSQRRGGRPPKPMPSVLSWSEQDALLQAALDNPRAATGARDYALIALLLITGLRCEELCELTWRQIDLDAASIRLTGKGGKDRLVRWGYDADLARAALSHWQSYRQPNARHVIHTRTGARMTHTGVYQQIGSYLDRAGIDPVRRGPHLLRHTAISRQLARGVPVPQVQTNAGHESLATLQRYAHLLE